ncbi:hypothetical protein EYF80_046031 [Liparis tanakae]|uniref:Uncharacterized protein n=1 Tax=Liparis tanakae TaxID=230148 RepID=A0A4Z2FSA6_9TELE|nr:hypothetical protein EYF80_046031 [Liparis tanakae]
MRTSMMGRPYVTFPVASMMMTVKLRVILTMPPVKQAGQLRLLQLAEGRLVLGAPLVQVGHLAPQRLLRRALPRLQLRVLRVPVTKRRVNTSALAARWPAETATDRCSRLRTAWPGSSAPSRKESCSCSVACSFSPWLSSSCSTRYSSTASSTCGSTPSISSRFLNQFTCAQQTAVTPRPPPGAAGRWGRGYRSRRHLDLSHPGGEEGARDVSLHLPLALLAVGLLASSSSVHGPGEAHLPPGGPVHQGVVDEGLQQGQEGFSAPTHHLNHLGGHVGLQQDSFRGQQVSRTTGQGAGHLFTGQPEDALHPGDSQSRLDVVSHPEGDLLWHPEALPWRHTTGTR